MNSDVAAISQQEGLPVTFSFVRVPFADNPNLRSQKGLFTVVRDAEADSNEFVSTPLDQLMQRLFDWDLESPTVEFDQLRKSRSDLFTLYLLKKSQSQELLALLSNLGYNAATMFPGYQGAAWAVEEAIGQTIFD